MAKKSVAVAARESSPADFKVTEASALRLSAMSDVPAKELVGLALPELADKFRFRIDPLLLLFRKVCGTVVKTDPVTGVEYPVPFATVLVEDTDCSLLGFFPGGSPWTWYFPFRCRREVIATARTDACGNFCVWVPRWDIDWVLRFRRERRCFPIVFERPNLRDLLEDLIPRRIPIPIPEPGPDPAPDFMPLPGLAGIDRARLLARVTETAGKTAALRIDRQADVGFGARTVELEAALDAPVALRMAPPLPKELRAKPDAAGNSSKGQRAASPDAHAKLISSSLAARLQLDERDLAGLDLRRFIGPFKRCFDVFVPQWVPIIDVPDITFRVTQDVDGDGDEETIYGETLFDVRWNSSGPIGPLKLEAGPQARAGLPCGPTTVPCGNVPAIVLAGRHPVVGDATLYDGANGYALRSNRPHPSGLFNDPLPNPNAASPFTGTVALYGCNRTDPSATHYRVMYRYSADAGGSFTADAPFTGRTWPLFRLDGTGTLLEWHYPAADSNGWYPINLPPGPNAWLPQDLLLDWPTNLYPDGRYVLRLEVGTGGVASSQSADVAFNIDNSQPRGPIEVQWSFGVAGPWQPLGTICPIVRRGTTPSDLYFRVTCDATAEHLRSVSLSASGCGSGDFVFVSGSGGDQASPGSTTYRHWHVDVNDNDQLLEVVYRLPATASEGTYSFGAFVASRAFNPSGGDGGHLAAPAWQYDPVVSYIVPSVAFSVFNSN